MESTKSAAKPPILKPKPRGINVKAFIEKVESGSKPSPDFFKSSSTSPTKDKVIPEPNPDQPAKPDPARKPSLSKPPLISKKPSLTNKPVADIAKPVGPPPPPPSSSTSGVSLHAEEEAASEDSGHSTCDLKYSGSISSNQSSSHDPHYQALSELDDGYSEHMSSNDGAVTAHEPPQYSDPAAAGVVHTNLHDVIEGEPDGTAAIRAHHQHTNHYKYHVPNKITGTLPRDRKKAAAMGKAVAKGRSTIKRKIPSSTDKSIEDDSRSGCSSIRDNTLKACQSGDSHSNHVTSDQDIYSDDFYDSDFSDSEWETDGEHSNISSDQMPDNPPASTPKPTTTNAHNNNDYINTSNKPTENDSDYDTFMERDGGSGVAAEALQTRPKSVKTNKSKRSSSKFYDEDGEELDNSQKFVTLMKEHNSKKEKKAQLKRSSQTRHAFKQERRFRQVKGNIKDLKQRATVQKQSLVNYIGKKLKKPVVPKQDYALDSDTIGDDDVSSVASSMRDMRDKPSPRRLSTFSTGAQSDSQSDVHSISSQNSSNLHHSQHGSNLHHSHSTASADRPHTFTPRNKATAALSAADARQRTQSLGALLVPPPLPPRNTRSQIYPNDHLDDLPPPPPPTRTTSLAVSSGDDGGRFSSLSIPPSLDRHESGASSCSSSSYTPKFVKASKPSASPRSPRITQHNENSPRLSIPSAQPGDMPPTLHKNHSAPVLPTSPDGPSPLVPIRRESSKSLVASSNDDESIQRRNEIITSAARTSIMRKSSLKGLTPSPVEEEATLPTLSQSAPVGENMLAPSSGGSFVIGEDDSNTVADILIEDEPLYQEYHECMLSHVKASSISKNSEEDEASTLMRGGQPSLSLWSTTPQVINTGVLDHMNNEEIKLQEAMFEVISSEASYLRSINMLVKVFVNSEAFTNEDILSNRDKKALFSNIEAVQEVSSRLFTELEAHWKKSVILTAVCEIIYNYAHREFDVYIKYCSNQAFQDRTLKKLLSQSASFTEALNTLERSPECHGLSMSSFLLLPMQRITRLPLLLDAIQRRQEIWSDQYRAAQLCYEHIKKVVSRCNEGARKMEQTEQVLSIENKLMFSKLKKIPLTTASRHLVKKGELVHLAADGGRSAANILALKPKKLSLFLFNDLLMITKKKEDNFSVIDYTSRVNVEIEEWSVGTLKDPRLNVMAQKCQAKFLFMLILLENHQKKHAEFLLACNTETERTRWVEAFTPQTHDDSEDKIYESWDCPQVQVTHEYAAQQPDELNLEPGEKINVLRKTADGWYEGERVTDGQHGWLPSSYTVELQNEHVRARHLKTRYKLLQAAAKLMK